MNFKSHNSMRRSQGRVSLPGDRRAWFTAGYNR